MDGPLPRPIVLGILGALGLLCISMVFGFDAPTARGQALLGLLVSLTGILIVLASPHAQEA